MQVHFLPWAGDIPQTTIGPVTLTPWQVVRAHLPADVAGYLDHYFSKHQHPTTKPVKHITLAGIGADPVGDTTASERATIRSAIDLLTFTSIIPNLRARITTGNDFATPNSERFQLTTQHFNLQPFVAISTKGLVHTWGIDKIHFCMPWDAGADAYKTDTDLLDALGNVLKGTLADSTRILRAVEWFRLAHTGSPETNDASRLVMMATAFEVLLEPPEDEKKAPMAVQLHLLTANDSLAIIPVTIAKKTYNLNAVAAWFCTFYALRNKIVHGGLITITELLYRDEITQLDVADLVLWEAISWELANAHLIGGIANEHAEELSQLFSKKPAEPAFVRTVMSSSMGIDVDEYHQALGWQPDEANA